MNKFRNTGNIFNDLEAYKDKEIFNRINVMLSSSNKDSLNLYHNTKTNLYYEVSVKLENELDQRIYKYKTLNEALTATYFLNLLVQKEGYTTIQDYKLFTTIKDGNNKIIVEDTTDNFHYWRSTIEVKQQKEIEELQIELELYKKYLSIYNIDRSKIEKHFKEVVA